MNGITWKCVPPTEQHDNIIIVGSGPSLKGFDFNRLLGLGHIITVNDAGKHVPFADSWFTLDPWGLHGPQLPPPTFKGKMYAAVPDDYGRIDAKSHAHRVTPNPRIIFLHRLMRHNHIGESSTTAIKFGLSLDSDCISTGNSGYGALNLAFHMKPKKILLLGIDGNIGYFYTTLKRNRALTHLPAMFKSSQAQVEDNGITVINGSENSTVNCFPRYPIDEAIEAFKK